VILNEAKKLVLIGEIGAQMEPNTLCIVLLQTVIQLLVIAKVESLLLKLPFQVPVSFSDKQKFRMRFFDGGDDIEPILC